MINTKLTQKSISWRPIMNTLYNSTSSGFYKSFQVEGENIIVSTWEYWLLVKSMYLGVGVDMGGWLPPFYWEVPPPHTNLEFWCILSSYKGDFG